MIGIVEVTVRGKNVPLRAWQVDRYLTRASYLREPERDEDRWITQRLYGGGVEDRRVQEIVLGVGGVRLLTALGEKTEVFHFNEGHAVFAGLRDLARAVLVRPPGRGLRLPDVHRGPSRRSIPAIDAAVSRERQSAGPGEGQVLEIFGEMGRHEPCS